MSFVCSTYVYDYPLAIVMVMYHRMEVMLARVLRIQMDPTIFLASAQLRHGSEKGKSEKRNELKNMSGWKECLPSPHTLFYRILSRSLLKPNS